MAKTRGAQSDAIRMRVASPFMHRGVHVLVGQVIECTPTEAQGAQFHGWAIPLDAAEGRHKRRDMRAEP